MPERFTDADTLRRFASEIVRKNGKYTSKDIRRFIFAGERMAYDRSLPSGAAMHRIMNALYTLERYTRPNSGANRYEADNVSELHAQARRLAKMANVKAAGVKSDRATLARQVQVFDKLIKSELQGLQTARPGNRMNSRMYDMASMSMKRYQKQILRLAVEVRRLGRSRDDFGLQEASQLLLAIARLLNRLMSSLKQRDWSGAWVQYGRISTGIGDVSRILVGA